MFVAPADRPFGEEPQRPKKDFTPSSKGYPAVQDPAADGRQKSSLSNIGAGDEYKLRQKYGPARVM